MPSPDFIDRLLESQLEGGVKRYFWHKDVVSTAIKQVNCLLQAAGSPAAVTYGGTALEAYSIGPNLAPNMLGGSAAISPNSVRAFVTKFEVFNPVSNLAGCILLGDALASYRGIPADTAVAQDLSTKGSAAGRSVLPRYSDGLGVRIFADVTTAVGANPVTLTVTYTNESGTSGRVSTSTTTASAPATRALVKNLAEPFSLPLQAGDKGVRSIQTAQLSGTTGAAGVYTLLLYKPILLSSVLLYGTANSGNYGRFQASGAADCPEIKSGAHLFTLWYPPTTATTDTLSGSINITHVNRGR